MTPVVVPFGILFFFTNEYTHVYIGIYTAPCIQIIQFWSSTTLTSFVTGLQFVLRDFTRTQQIKQTISSDYPEHELDIQIVVGHHLNVQIIHSTLQIDDFVSLLL